MVNNNMYIELVYASESEHKLLKIKVPVNTNIKSAIEQSGILELFPELKTPFEQDLLKIGVFSRFRQLTYLLKPNDRIEIYRELLIDPKDARRLKAKARDSNLI